MPLALSVHNFISSVGADAGFAAIIGLAILVLLYFAHARETANLREQAALLTQRLQQAEARVAELTRVHAAEAVQAAQRTAVRVAPVPAGVGAMPGAPAGMAAPALAAATRVVPIASPPAPAPAEEVDQGAAVSVGAAVVPEAAEAAGEEIPPGGGQVPPAEPEQALVGGEHDGPLPPDGEEIAISRLGGPATVAGANGAGQDRAVAPAAAALAAAGALPPRAPAGRRPLTPLPPPPQRDRRAARWLAALIGAALLAVAIAAVIIVTSNSGTQNQGPGRTTNSPVAGGTRHRPLFKPGSVTVAVLNGTSTNQLAHQVAARLAAVGYREGTIATAANQTETTTVVSYVSGSGLDKADALHVATALKLSPTSVQPINQSAQQVACPPPAACTANVVVTVGADLASS